MKIQILLFLLTSFCLSQKVQCQAKIQKLFLDNNFEETTQKRALYIGEGMEEGGLYVLNCYWSYNKKLALVVHFTNASLKVLDGKYVSYYNKKNIESEGNYNKGKKDGVWKYMASNGKLEDSTIYKEGKIIFENDFYYFKNGTVNHERIIDNTKGIFKTITYSNSGQIKSEFLEKNNICYIKTFLDTIINDTFYLKKDTIITKQDTAGVKYAEYNGGIKAWSKFLANNLNANTPSDKGAPPGKYEIIISFIVLKNGTIEGIKAETNKGYGTEREVMRLIYETPNWIPATRDGKPIISIYKQPVTFVIAED